MQRRSFLAALGIGAAEIVCMNGLWALQSVSASTTTAKPVTDAVRFKKLSGKFNFQLLQRKGFQSYINTQFPGVIAPFNHNLPLPETITSWVSSGFVAVAHNRYLVVSGFMKHAADNRGLLWIDATKPRGGAPPLAVFTFLAQQGHNALWIYPNQPISTLTRKQLPHHFPMTMNRWLRSRKPKREDHGYIKQVVFCEPTAQAATEKGAATLESFGIKRYRTSKTVSMQRTYSGVAS